jgi:hypothetical protein
VLGGGSMVMMPEQRSKWYIYLRSSHRNSNSNPLVHLSVNIPLLYHSLAISFRAVDAQVSSLFNVPYRATPC